MKIRTEFVYPPIPLRQWDWSAVDDSTYNGPGCIVGWGRTERDAVIDLYEQIYEDHDIADLQAEFDRLRPKVETGEQAAHLDWLTQKIAALKGDAQ